MSNRAEHKLADGTFVWFNSYPTGVVDDARPFVVLSFVHSNGKSPGFNIAMPAAEWLEFQRWLTESANAAV